MDAKTRQAIQDILAANCELLTIPETAARLRVNKNTVYDLIKKGYLKSIKLGCRKVSVRALAEFIERCESGEIELRPLWASIQTLRYGYERWITQFAGWVKPVGKVWDD